MTNWSRILFAAAAMMLLAGCATSRSVLPINAAPAYEAPNPATGPAVKLTASDARVFERKPATPDIPSLKNGEITNTAITSRAIGRKRNSYGKAIGDVLLPEGQTVAKTIEGTAASAFRSAGYRVLSPGAPGYEDALPVDITIHQYWSWMNFGFWEGSVTCRAEVTVTAPLPGFESGRKIKTEADNTLQFVTDKDWQKAASDGLMKLNQALLDELPRPAPGS